MYFLSWLVIKRPLTATARRKNCGITEKKTICIPCLAVRISRPFRHTGLIL